MTRFEVYNGIAKALARDDVQYIVRGGAWLDYDERQVLEHSILEVINAINFCIRYNWPINTYFKERRQHDAAD